MQTEHFMQRMGEQPHPPQGHHVLARDTWEDVTYVNRATIELPGIGGGWATCQIAGLRFCSWVEPVAVSVTRIGEAS